MTEQRQRIDLQGQISYLRKLIEVYEPQYCCPSWQYMSEIPCGSYDYRIPVYDDDKDEWSIEVVLIQILPRNVDGAGPAVYAQIVDKFGNVEGGAHWHGSNIPEDQLDASWRSSFEDFKTYLFDQDAYALAWADYWLDCMEAGADLVGWLDSYAPNSQLFLDMAHQCIQSLEWIDRRAVDQAMVWGGDPTQAIRY